MNTELQSLLTCHLQAAPGRTQCGRLLFPFVLCRIPPRCQEEMDATSIREARWIEHCPMQSGDVTDAQLLASPQPPLSPHQTLADWKDLPTIELVLDDGCIVMIKKAVCSRDLPGEVSRCVLSDGTFLWTIIPQDPVPALTGKHEDIYGEPL